MLEYFLERPGRVFSRAQLLDDDVHIGRLRKALSRGRERDPIRTVRSSGYALDEMLVQS